jgi:RNA polymerase sigma-70 factor (ECF subfamily)
MGNFDCSNPVNSPQIIPFPVEKPPPQLSIYADDANFKLFYDKYYSLVKDRCMAILRNNEDAQDMAQSVFTKILENKAKGRPGILYPKTYLSTMAKNMIINQRKKARRELIEIYDMATNGSLNWFMDKGDYGRENWEAGIIDKGYEQAEAKIIVNAILDEQDETTRKIYFYKYHDGLTLVQTGEIVGLGKSAVDNRIKNLEKKVKAALGKAGA